MPWSCHGHSVVMASIVAAQGRSRRRTKPFAASSASHPVMRSRTTQGSACQARASSRAASPRTHWARLRLTHIAVCAAVQRSVSGLPARRISIHPLLSTLTVIPGAGPIRRFRVSRDMARQFVTEFGRDVHQNVIHGATAVHDDQCRGHHVRISPVSDSCRVTTVRRRSARAEVAAATDSELAVGAGEALLHGAPADPELLRDLLVGGPGPDHGHGLLLARGEPVGPGPHGP